MITPNSSSSAPKCRQCGSPLVFVKKSTLKLENSNFQTTTTVYRCSNKECQEDMDKKEAVRKKQLADQAAAREKRAQDTAQQKQNEQNIKRAEMAS